VYGIPCDNLSIIPISLRLSGVYVSRSPGSIIGIDVLRSHWPWVLSMEQNIKLASEAEGGNFVSFLHNPFSAWRSFRPKRANLNFQHSAADGGWRRFIYQGFRFAPPLATKISPLRG